MKSCRQQFEVAASAISVHQILHCLSCGNVDVALINKDLSDGPLAGLRILPELVVMFQKTPIIILFDTWEDDLIVDAFRAGAAGVFCRSENNLEMLWRCIRAVSAGQVWANSGQLHLLLRALRKTAPLRTVASCGKNLLTARETQVANLVAEGLPNREIATRLFLSQHTVSNYVFHIYNKLGISSRVELARYIMNQTTDEPRQVD